MPLPFAFGVSGLAWPQEDRDGKKEQLRKKAIGQRPEPSLSGPRLRVRAKKRKASVLAALCMDTCVGH